MHVCLDGNIYLDRIEEKSENWANSLFVVVPMRLGLNTILPEYLESIKRVFAINQNVGIAGGRDFSALYFIGITDVSENLIYLDPHLVQQAIPTREAISGNLANYINQYHCSRIKKLPLNRMCTSLAIGFYIKDKEEFD